MFNYFEPVNKTIADVFDLPFSYPEYHKHRGRRIPLTDKQRKQRKKNKVARKQRRINKKNR